MKQDWVQFNNKPIPHGAKPFPPTRLEIGEELPEVAQAFQRQPHEPVNPHACWLQGLFTRIACQALPCLVDAPTRLKTPPKIISLVPDHLFLWRLFRNLHACGLLVTCYVWSWGIPPPVFRNLLSPTRLGTVLR